MCIAKMQRPSALRDVRGWRYAQAPRVKIAINHSRTRVGARTIADWRFSASGNHLIASLKISLLTHFTVIPCDFCTPQVAPVSMTIPSIMWQGRSIIFALMETERDQFRRNTCLVFPRRQLIIVRFLSARNDDRLFYLQPDFEQF